MSAPETPRTSMTSEQLARLEDLLKHPEKAEAMLDPSERKALRKAAQSVKERVVYLPQVSVGFIVGRFTAPVDAERERMVGLIEDLMDIIKLSNINGTLDSYYRAKAFLREHGRLGDS